MADESRSTASVDRRSSEADVPAAQARADGRSGTHAWQSPSSSTRATIGRLLFPGLLLLLAAGSGCLESGAGDSFCARATPTETVHAVTGSDIAIAEGTLILHAGEAEVLLRGAGGTCTAIAVGAVRVGDRLAHDADAIAESYPAQAWPRHILVER